MVISGLNVTPANLSNLNNRSENSSSAQQGAGGSRQVVAGSQTSATGGPATVTNDGSQITSSTTGRISPPSQSEQAIRTVTSRRDPAETEAFANQFRLQRESDQGNPQVREFVTVANFEQRDQLAQSTGIDVFV